MFETQLLSPFRRKYGQSFRKSLGVYHYKIGKINSHKKPGLIPLDEKNRLLNHKDKTYGQNMILHKERNSPKLFGKFVKGGFKFDKEKVPFYNVPNLTDFQLKPYVSSHTPQISDEIKQQIQRLNDFTLEENFNRFRITGENILDEQKKLEDNSQKN